MEFECLEIQIQHKIALMFQLIQERHQSALAKFALKYKTFVLFSHTSVSRVTDIMMDLVHATAKLITSARKTSQLDS